MSFDPERSKKIVDEMTEVLGAGAVIEFAGNTNYLLSSLLKANGVKPSDLEGQLALQQFFTEVIINLFGVNREILDLEIQKCYVVMEDIVNKAKATIPENATKSEDCQTIAPQDIEELSKVLDISGMMGMLEPPPMMMRPPHSVAPDELEEIGDPLTCVSDIGMQVPTVLVENEDGRRINTRVPIEDMANALKDVVPPGDE